MTKPNPAEEPAVPSKKLSQQQKDFLTSLDMFSEDFMSSGREQPADQEERDSFA